MQDIVFYMILCVYLLLKRKVQTKRWVSGVWMPHHRLTPNICYTVLHLHSFFFFMWNEGIEVVIHIVPFFDAPPPKTFEVKTDARHSHKCAQTLTDLHSWVWNRAPRRRSHWSTSRRRRSPCWWQGEESGSLLACRNTEEKNAVTFPTNCQTRRTFRKNNRRSLVATQKAARPSATKASGIQWLETQFIKIKHK